MKVAITDANIFIDLVKLQLLGYLFSIELEIYVTSEVVEQLNADQFEKVDSFIQAKALIVYYFTAAEIADIDALKVAKGLEVADKSVLYLAKKIQAKVLSGDALLRKVCLKNGLEVMGIIWLFDAFVKHGLINYFTAIEKMKMLVSFNNRLPMDECEIRIKKWSQLL
jgi:predicted nucleic acid-binding protein